VTNDHAVTHSGLPAAAVAALAAACDRASSWPLPGRGQTVRRLALLGSAAEDDLVLGRLVEAHADAVAIIAELAGPPIGPGQRWGVWAAGPADSLQAWPDGHGWRIEGTKAWCSGASLVTHALVDATTPYGQQLFAVDLGDPGSSRPLDVGRVGHDPSRHPLRLLPSGPGRGGWPTRPVPDPPGILGRRDRRRGLLAWRHPRRSPPPAEPVPPRF
jgi:hypothetical protein